MSSSSSVAAPSRIAVGIGRLVLRAGTYPGRRLVGFSQRRRGRKRGGERFRVDSVDDIQLDAWHEPANPDVPRKLPVVMCHGWSEVKELHFPRARLLAAAGHDVLLFDHRGHGNSTGKYATFGVREREDVSHVISAAAERGIVSGQVITVGFSMGAATVLQHAAGDERVAGVVALAPFADFHRAVESFRNLLAPWVSLRWLVGGVSVATREAGFEMSEASTVEAVATLNVPVLLIEGAQDRNLPPDQHVRPLQEAMAANPKVELFTVVGANHVKLAHRPWPEMDQRIRAFCAGLSEPSTPAEPTP